MSCHNNGMLFFGFTYDADVAALDERSLSLGAPVLHNGCLFAVRTVAFL